MTTEEFAAAYPSESRYVEWKSGSGSSALQRAIVAFSNAEGGVLLLGVDDRGSPTGLPFTEGLEKDLWEIANLIESPGSIEMRGLRVGSVEITVISVSTARQGVAMTSGGAVLIRRGKQNLPLRSSGLVQLVSQRAQESFDAGLWQCPAEWWALR